MSETKAFRAAALMVLPEVIRRLDGGEDSDDIREWFHDLRRDD